MRAYTSFQGHKFIKLITPNWVLDATEGVGYKVKTDKKGNVLSYIKTFRMNINRQSGEISFKKYEDVPVKILAEAKIVAENYMTSCK